MQSFSSFLAEGRDAPLYHGTDRSAMKILEMDAIEPRTSHSEPALIMPKSKRSTDMGFHHKHISGVSMSRSLKFAQNWKNGFVFEFDQAKLARDYKIVPIDYFTYNVFDKDFNGSSRNSQKSEHEEFVVTSQPLPLNRYMTRFWCSKQYFMSAQSARDPNFITAFERYVQNNPKFAGVF